MKFKLDENLPAELVGDLSAAGHEAQTAPEEGLTGAPDPVLVERVRTEGRILLTMDKGIADTRTYSPSQYAGIILFRPPSSGRGAVLTFIRRHLSAILADCWLFRSAASASGDVGTTTLELLHFLQQLG